MVGEDQVPPPAVPAEYAEWLLALRPVTLGGLGRRKLLAVPWLAATIGQISRRASYDPLIATSPTQLRRPRSDTLGITDVLGLAERGRLRVPAFQRPFVWDDEDIRSLFDSIWRGFPVGTLLLWTRPAPEDQVRFGPVRIEAPAVDSAYWVVDGQQRVTSLVGALSPNPTETDPHFDLCFDLRRARFVHAGKRPQPTWWLPLRVTLESRTLLNWVREGGAGLEADELDRADELAGALRDYKIPAYVVEHDDEGLLRDVFDRVNSAGKPISRAQVFHALFGGESPIASAQAVVEALAREGFGEFDDQRIVQSLLAIRGGDVARDLHDEFAPNEDRDVWFDDTERALVRVLGFLRRQGVPHLQLVPSTFPVPVLAAFFHLHPEPDSWNERLLARWLWRGWVHGYGRSGQTPALRQAVRAVHPTKGAPERAPSEHDAVRALLSGVQDDPPTAVDVATRTDTASGRLVLLALANLRPRAADGEPIDLAAELNRHGVEAVTELVRGHRSDLGARGFWPKGAPPPTGHESASVLESHAIDPAAADALRRGDVNGVLEARRRHLSAIVREFLSSRVEAGAIVRPPLGQLFVPDDELVDR